MRLTKTFNDEQFASALESWGWIGLDRKKPTLASLFGDVFFASNDGWWFLDLIEGSLTNSWPDRDSLQQDLETEDGQDRYLLGGLAMSAERRGLTLQPNEVYTFVVPPVLGGQATIDNVHTTDFDVALTIAGQLHQSGKTHRNG